MKKIKLFISKCVLVTLLSSNVGVQAYFDPIETFSKAKDYAQKKYNYIKEKYETAKKYAKYTQYTAYGLGAVAGYKKIVMPITKFVFGKKSSITSASKKINKGINWSLFAACSLGVVYLYDKLINQGKIINGLESAKADIIKKFDETKTKIKKLKEYVKNGFSETNKKLDAQNEKLTGIKTGLDGTKKDIQGLRNTIEDTNKKTTFLFNKFKISN